MIDDHPAKGSVQQYRDGHIKIIPAIFEIKGLRVTHHNYPLNATAVEKRAEKVPEEYVEKAQGCDDKFAHETRSDTTHTQGPFEMALSGFHSGGPIPLVIGGISEVSSKVDEVLTTVAKSFATTPDGLSVSPELSSRGSNGAFRILLAQFRCIIGCTAARANADLKLRRKHYIRPTRASAIQAAKQQHRNTQQLDNDSKFDIYDYSTQSQYHEFYLYRSAYQDFHTPNFHNATL